MPELTARAVEDLIFNWMSTRSWILCQHNTYTLVHYERRLPMQGNAVDINLSLPDGVRT